MATKHHGEGTKNTSRLFRILSVIAPAIVIAAGVNLLFEAYANWAAAEGVLRGADGVVKAEGANALTFFGFGVYALYVGWGLLTKTFLGCAGPRSLFAAPAAGLCTLIALHGIPWAFIPAAIFTVWLLVLHAKGATAQRKAAGMETAVTVADDNDKNLLTGVTVTPAHSTEPESEPTTTQDQPGGNSRPSKSVEPGTTRAKISHLPKSKRRRKHGRR